MLSISGELRALEQGPQLYSVEQALELAATPLSRMLDEGTCERIEGTRRRGVGGEWVPVPFSASVLYRKGSREPFMRVSTREDGVYVARFPAIPGEIVYARAYLVDPATGQEHFGKPKAGVCAPAGRVDVGAPSQVDVGSDSSAPSAARSGE